MKERLSHRGADISRREYLMKERIFLGKGTISWRRVYLMEERIHHE
jgi:hypothetical protein